MTEQADSPSSETKAAGLDRAGMPAESESWEVFLRQRLVPPCVVLAAGNRLRADDGVGVEIVERIPERCRWIALDGGMAPENLIGPLCRLQPKTVLLIDAAHFGAPAGTIRLFEGNELAEVDISTHSLSPKLFLEHLQRRTGAAVYLLGIQPERCTFGEPLSRHCLEAAEVVLTFLGKC